MSRNRKMKSFKKKGITSPAESSGLKKKSKRKEMEKKECLKTCSESVVPHEQKITSELQSLNSHQQEKIYSRICNFFSIDTNSSK